MKHATRHGSSGMMRHTQHGIQHVSSRADSSDSSTRLRQILGIAAELLFTFAAICGMYIAWQLWWTGVESEHAQAEQRSQVDWTDPASQEKLTIAKAQSGAPPAVAKPASEGQLFAQIYIPRFGAEWNRNVVEGISLDQLAKHGLGHYPQTQMPGQLGNFAVAGHRAGYGQPLGDIDKLQTGDKIIVRTKDYWFVYTYTSHEIVLPTQVGVIAANPDDPQAQPTKRLITLTTCEPKYETATHRWIAYGEMTYWAKASDGIPKELAQSDSTGAVKFINNEQQSPVSRIGSLAPVVLLALVAYLVVFLAAALVWRWPVLAAIRRGDRPKPDASIYGSLARLQPGVLLIRIVLLALLAFATAAALFQWVFPWSAANIPFLQVMSNYVTV